MKCKLQRQLSRIIKGKKYWKYVVVIPNKIIKNKKLSKRKYVEVKIR